MEVLRSLLYVFKYIFIMLIISYINFIYGINNQVIMFIEYLIALILIVFPFKDKIIKDSKNFNIKKVFKSNIRTYLIGFLLMFITNMIVQTVFNGIAPNEQMNRKLLKSMPIFYIIIMCFVTPFIEEISFRQSFSNTFKNKKTNIIVTGLLFGLMHVILSFTNMYSLLFVVPYSILGLTFSYIYFNEKNIFASILFHSFHNILSIIVILLI